jgi:ComEC/Rec2-related protein
MTGGGRHVVAFLAMTIVVTLDKISASPSQSLLIWIGAFVIGIGAATCIFPIALRPNALPAAFACLLLAIASGAIIKNKKIRLFIVAGFFLIGGVCRFLSANSDPVDLLKYLPALALAKAWLIASVERLLPEPQAGFLVGLLVGGGVRSPELKAAFVATGTAHVMALSGYNIMIVNRWLDRVLSWLRFGKRARWAIGGVGVCFFVIATGASPSLVRAAVMSVISIIALSCGRRSMQGRVVVYAASLMLFFSPTLLRTDLGFILSVAATLGLIFIAPIIEPFAGFLPKLFGIRKTAGETVAATLATLPFCLAAFGKTSLVALPANLLLLPFVPATMGAGFLSAFFAGVFPPLAAIAKPVAAIFVDYDISLVRLLARTPGASLNIIGFGYVAAAIAAIGIIAAALRYHLAYGEKTNA